MRARRWLAHRASGRLCLPARLARDGRKAEAYAAASAPIHAHVEERAVMTATSPVELPEPLTVDVLMRWLHQQLQECPVRYDPAQSCWDVFSHADILRVLTDSATFASDVTMFTPRQADLDLFARGNFVRMDPPRHRKLRELVSQAFTPRVIAELAPRITALATELLDRCSAKPRFDIVEALTHPLPVIVIAEMLGIPTADRPLFRYWSDAMFTRSDPHAPLNMDEPTVRYVGARVGEMNRYLLAHIRERRQRPAADLISQLTRAELDGQTLEDEEIIGFVGLLLLAGHVTTTALLGNAILCLDAHPQAAAELRADPTGLPAAIEEVLRYYAPFPRLVRRTTTAVELGGAQIPAEQLLVLWLVSANRDPAQFRDPDRFDIHRKPNPHLSFGHSIHFCLGAPLARLEARIALQLLLSRYQRIAVDHAAANQFHHPLTMMSAKKLMVEVEAVPPAHRAAS
jgi:cytochrome P450